MKKIKVTCDVSMINKLAAKGSHVSFLVEQGRCIPKSKAMFKRWRHLDVLGQPDVDFILFVFPGAEFKKTKSGNWARLLNFDEFKDAYAKHLNRLDVNTDEEVA